MHWKQNCDWLFTLFGMFMFQVPEKIINVGYQEDEVKERSKWLGLPDLKCETIRDEVWLGKLVLTVLKTQTNMYVCWEGGDFTAIAFKWQENKLQIKSTP